MLFELRPEPSGLLLLLFPEGEEFSPEELQLLEPYGAHRRSRYLELSFHHGEEGELTRLLNTLATLPGGLRYQPL